MAICKVERDISVSPTCIRKIVLLEEKHFFLKKKIVADHSVLFFFFLGESQTVQILVS